MTRLSPVVAKVATPAGELLVRLLRAWNSATTPMKATKFSLSPCVAHLRIQSPTVGDIAAPVAGEEEEGAEKDVEWPPLGGKAPPPPKAGEGVEPWMV